jgi:beta-barrel assembly-enhancing protease
MNGPSPPSRVLAAALVAVLASWLGAAGCASSGVNQGDVNLVSLEQEWQLGQQLEADIARQLRLSRDSTLNNYVNGLGQRLVQQTEMRNLPWKFHVVEDPEINAFNIPGGHVYVNTGLIAAADNASELAGVMAHEIAHGVARHGTEQLTRVYGLNILAGLLLGENPAAYQQILAQILGTGAIARFSRSAEQEADVLGVRTLYEARYHPEGLIGIFQKLLSRRQGNPNSVDKFFSTHPLTENRIRDTRAEIAKLPSTSGLQRDDAGFAAARQRAR